MRCRHRLHASPDPDGFPFFASWDLSSRVHVHPMTVGSEDRPFPAVVFMTVISRRPEFFLLNIATPMCAFVVLAFLQVRAASRADSYPRPMLDRCSMRAQAVQPAHLPTALNSTNPKFLF